MKKSLLTALLSMALLCGCAKEEPAGEEVQTLHPADAQETEPVQTEEEGNANAEALKSLTAAALPAGFELTQEMLDAALLRDGDLRRLEDVMLRAARGEKITLAYLGGSITAGSNASPMETNCWAALTTQWWKDTFPNAQIEYVNAGIGATDSWVGVHRVEQDILVHEPDVVVVEFSVNDGQVLNKETYDSLLKRLLNSESAPAVVPLMLATAGSTYAPEHGPLALKYDLPIIGYYNLLDSGLIAWDMVGDTDGVHPKNEGHSLIAALMCSYYGKVLDTLKAEVESKGYDEVAEEAAAGRPGEEKSDSLTQCRYTKASFIYSDDTEGVEIETEGFAPMEQDGWFIHGKGWVSDEAGTISFTVTAKTFGIAYTEYKTAPENGCAVYDVYVDDEKAATIDSCAPDTWGNKLQYFECLKEDEAQTHTVRLLPAEGNEGQHFTILGLAVGE